MSYPSDPEDFLDTAPADLSKLRVALSPDLGFAPTSQMIRRVFAARVAKLQPHLAVAEEDQPDLTTAARVNWVIRCLLRPWRYWSRRQAR